MLRARRSRLFLAVLLLLLTPVLAALALGAAILWRGGEFVPEADILARLATGRRVIVHRFDDRTYRRALYDLQKPEVVIFGASRAMRFRSDMFRVPFVNLAAGQASPEGLLREAEYYFVSHKPRYVLWEVNFQTFNDGREAVLTPPQHITALRNRLLLPYQLVHDGHLEWDDLADVLVGSAPREVAGIELVGLLARTRHTGSNVDGSKLSVTRSAQGEHLRIHSKTWRDIAFVAGKGIGEEKIARIARVVEEFRRRGMVLIPFAAPYAPTAWAVLNEDPDFAHIRRWAAAMAREIPTFQDFLDPVAILAPDCEFEDDNHGGDVAYFRLLQAWARRDPDGLGRLIDTARMAELARANGGKVNVPVDPLLLALLPPGGEYISDRCRARAPEGRT